MRIRAAVLIALIAAAQTAAAQRVPTSAVDSIMKRANRMANDGNAPAARALVDSVLKASRDGSIEYADALYARASLAESSEQARRDYLRLVVEFSFSPRSEDAMLRLAQIEMSRGDRASAKKYLTRLSLEYPTGPTRASADYWMGRVLLDEGSMAAGCASLGDARTHAAPTDFELLNQINYYSRQCAAIQRAADQARADSIQRADSVTRADSIKAASKGKKGRGVATPPPKKEPTPPPRKEATPPPRKDSTPPARTEPPAPVAAEPASTPTPKGPYWTVQVAAYSQESDAVTLAERLKTRGYDARVTSNGPYRVRIGRYTKRLDAIALAAKLKAASVTAVVVEGEHP